MIEPSGFREIARSATVSHPIPFAFALCLAFAVVVLGGAVLTDGLLRWVMVAFGAVSVTFAFGVLASAAIWKPELLRSEHHEIRSRVINFIEDSDFAPEAVEAGRLFLDQREKKTAARQRTPNSESNGK